MMMYLFTYPRSGSNWVRYIIEAISYRPVYDTGCYLGSRIKSLPTNPSLPRIEKKHKLNSVDEKAMTELIVVLRDPVEAITRHAWAEGPKYGATLQERLQKKLIDDSNPAKVNYIEPIKKYHEFSGSKLLIIYKDLMLNPKEEILKLGCFLKADLDVTREFLNNYEEHRSRSIKNYKGGSKTRGSDLDYWKRQVGSLAEKIHEHLKLKDEEVYNLYISQYKQ